MVHPTCSKNMAEGKAVYRGKKCKQRITVALFIMASGKKEKPIAIWKSENPRCLKRFDKSVLPVNFLVKRNHR